jgi:RNA polymerase sigma-70 factor (ECF subfamily)
MLTFESLYRQYAGDVFRFAHWLCRDRAEAEDVTAETFVRAWAGADRSRTATVKGYLFTIARNLARKRAQARVGQLELDEEAPAAPPRLDERLAANAELRQVLAALDELPPAAREALVLRADQGLSYQEIAALLGISVASAKVHVHRARHKLAASRNPPSGMIRKVKA